MRSLGDVLLTRGPFSEIVIGNTAVARAMLEAGIRVATSYPGSPTPEIATALAAIPNARRVFHFEFATNEKVALEVALGSALNGHPSLVFFKSVGLNVAADSFVQLGLLRIPGGLVVLLGDDPGANSSQNEQDNRHYARLAGLPLLEAADPQEAHDLFLCAAAWARELETAVILRLTTHVCHAKARVDFGEWIPPNPPPGPAFAPRGTELVPLVASIPPLRRVALARLEAFRRRFEDSPANRVTGQGSRRGIIATGLPRLTLLDVLEGSLEPPDVLELATVHPLPVERVATFLAGHDEVKLLEELDPFLEVEIKALAYDRRLNTRILGKADAEECIGEFLPERVEAILRAAWPDLLPPRELLPELPGREAVHRPAQLCPGCGHRSAFFALQRELGPEVITVADIGCHTMGHQAPYHMGQVLVSMGHAPSTGSGLALFNTERPVVAFLGDSTFFHAGLPAIANAVFNRHNLVLVILENGTTAMTGHQDHPGVGRNFNGEAPRVPLRQALEGLGVTSIREVDAYQGAKLANLVREALGETGFRVIIARHPCMLKVTREARRRPGFRERHVRIEQGLCTRAATCIEGFACPSFVRHPDGRFSVNRELCIGDGSCRQFCAAGAILPEEGRP
nr:thiamine pyrophosphate-dependent enzyme [uncultured Holophaga sp.]